MPSNMSRPMIAIFNVTLNPYGNTNLEPPFLVGTECSLKILDIMHDKVRRNARLRWSHKAPTLPRYLANKTLAQEFAWQTPDQVPCRSSLLPKINTTSSSSSSSSSSASYHSTILIDYNLSSLGASCKWSDIKYHISIKTKDTKVSLVLTTKMSWLGITG